MRAPLHKMIMVDYFKKIRMGCKEHSEVITDHNHDCIFGHCKKCGAINTLQESIIKQNTDVDWSKQVMWHQWKYILLDNGKNDTKKKQVIDKIRYGGLLHSC